MNAAGRPLAFSNWGAAYRERGVLAPGERILGAAGDGGVKVQSGTSFSTPIVSGVAGLLLSLQQKLGIVLSSKSIRNAILETTHGCDPQTETQCERVLAGRLNISGSVSAVTRGTKTMQNATTNPVHSIGAVPMNTEPGRLIPSRGDSVEPSACCGGCAGTRKQSAYVIGEISYDFPSLSRFQSLQHSLALLDSSGRQLQLQNSLDFARHLCGFTERRIEVNAGNIANDGEVTDAASPYNGLLFFETSNASEITAEDDGRCMLIQDVRVSENGGSFMPWINNGQPVRIGYLGATNKAKFCLQGIGYHHGAVKFDFSRASWILPRKCDAKDTRVHLPHRYDASSVVWKLVRGSTNMYAVEPASSFSEDAFDELTDFLLDSIGYGREGLDIYYYGWGDSIREWPGSWDPRFNVADCCFATEGNLSNCCDNYQNTSKTVFQKFKATPKPLARNRPRAQRVAIPGVLGGESELLNGQRLREIVPDMRGTLSWSTAKLLDEIIRHQPQMPTNVARQVREELERKLASLLQHFDRRVRNPGTSSAIVPSIMQRRNYKKYLPTIQRSWLRSHYR